MSGSRKKKDGIPPSHPYKKATSSTKTSTVVTDNIPQNEEPPLYKSISGSDLNDLFEQEEKLENTLILDCRAANGYEKKQIKTAHIIPTFQIPENKSFPTKKSVLAFYYERLATQIVTINIPGYYDNIILYDDNSTNLSISPLLKTLLAAIAKWSENTKTQVSFLDGGYQFISKEFANLLISRVHQVVELTAPKDYPLIIKTFPENISIVQGPSGGNVALEMQSLDRHMKDLDEAISKTLELLEFKKKVRVLAEIKKTLKQDEWNEMDADKWRVMVTTHGAVWGMLEEDIKATQRDFKVVLQELQVIKKKVADFELGQLDDGGMDEIPVLTRGLAEQFYAKKSSFHELEMNLVLEIFSKK